MRPLVLLILTALALALPARAEPPAQPQRLLIIGDSVSRGLSATDPGSTYAARLAAALGSSDALVRPAPRLEHAERRWGEVGAQGWDVVIVNVGLNDSRPTTTAPAAWAERYAGLARAISATGARLVCVTPFAMGDLPTEDAARAELIRQSCAGGAVADVYAATVGREGLRAALGAPVFVEPGEAPDSLHPNNAGHAEIARVILGALARAGRVSLPLVRSQP